MYRISSNFHSYRLFNARSYRSRDKTFLSYLSPVSTVISLERKAKEILLRVPVNAMRLMVRQSESWKWFYDIKNILNLTNSRPQSFEIKLNYNV